MASAVREYLGRDHDGAHSAVADVRATAAILDQQVVRHALPATPSELHASLIEVDVAGKFRRDEAGRVVFAFGKYASRSLDEIATADPGYLNWMLSRPFLDDVHALIRGVIADQSPKSRSVAPHSVRKANGRESQTK